MARKKTVEVTTTEREIADDVETKIPDGDLEADGIEALLGLAGDGARYTVHKEPSAPGGKRAYCATYTGDELSLDTIRDSFGGGDYRITGFDSGNRLTTSKRVSIIETAKPAGASAAPAAMPDSNMALFMKMFEQQGLMLTTVLGRTPTVAPAGPTAMELVTLIKALQPAKEASPIDTLLKGIELGKSLGGDGDVSMLGLGKTALEALAPLIAQGAAKPRAPAPAAPLPAPVQPAASAIPAGANGHAAPPPTGENVDVLKQLEWVRRIVADLTMRAKKGSDPELYADVMLDNLPPFITEDQIFERFSEPDALENLYKLHPPAKEYPAWFQQFRQAVLDTFVEEPDDTLPGEETHTDMDP